MEIRKVLVLLFDYLLSARKGLYVDVIFPIVVGIITFFLLANNLLKYNNEFIGAVITVLGIISGFGISSIALLISSDRKSVIQYKKAKTDTVIDGEVISYFRKLFILICYSTVVSFIGILLFFIGGIVMWNKILCLNAINVLKSLSISYISHVLIINIRGIASLYLMFVNDTNE